MIQKTTACLSFRRNGVDTTITVEAWTTLTPGLVVHRCTSCAMPNDCWVVSHERSGCAVGGHADGPESAHAFAAALGYLDWTKSASDLTEQVEANGTSPSTIATEFKRNPLYGVAPTESALAR